MNKDEAKEKELKDFERGREMDILMDVIFTPSIREKIDNIVILTSVIEEGPALIEEEIELKKQIFKITRGKSTGPVVVALAFCLMDVLKNLKAI